MKMIQRLARASAGLLALLALFALAACDMDEGQGSLCVSNESDAESGKHVTAVYVNKWGVSCPLLGSESGKPGASMTGDLTKTDSGFYLVYQGDIAPGESRFISLDEGEYSVAVATAVKVGGASGEEWMLPGSCVMQETGYKNYRKIKEDGTVTAIYDGRGIYFSEY